jgi:hypothetical protein
MCTATNTSAGTALPGGQQMDNDCKIVQCDGSGQEETVADTGDIPAGDGNPCTEEICNGDMPEHAPRPAGTPCGMGNQCDGNGNCN